MKPRMITGLSLDETKLSFGNGKSEGMVPSDSVDHKPPGNETMERSEESLCSYILQDSDFRHGDT
jgi:hypothetical protein